MMTGQDEVNNRSEWSLDDRLLPYEKILAHGLREVVSELCLIDPGILISYIWNDLQANIEDLVDSSSELFLKEGVLRYGHAATLDFEPGEAPGIVLDMEFTHAPATVFFKLTMHRLYVGISIQRILVGNLERDETFDANSFERVINDARLVPPKKPVKHS